MLALHGARTDHARLGSLLEPLQALGVGSLACDMSGHGAYSQIKLEHTSLAQNLAEAMRFADRQGAQLDTVFGHSLGGALALKVAERLRHRVRTLILSGPALYPEAAYAASQFGASFTEVISKPFGFMDSTSLPFLRRFSGNVILIVGEYDGLAAGDYGKTPGRSVGSIELADVNGSSRTVYSPIPAEVFHAIRAAASKLCCIVVEGADHKVFSHYEQYSSVPETLARYLHGEILMPSSSKNYLLTTSGELKRVCL